MKSYFTDARRFLWLIPTAVIFSLYAVINLTENADHTRAWNLLTPLDRAIPFVPGFVFIYLSLYFYLIFPFYFITGPESYRQVCLAACAQLLISYVFFVFLPTEYPRPVFKTDTFALWLLSFDNGTDKPYNCFPSLHAGMSSLYWHISRRLAPAISPWMLIWTISVSLSTLLVKEHFAADVVAAWILSFFTAKLVKPAEQATLPAGWALLPGGFYLLTLIIAGFAYFNRIG